MSAQSDTTTPPVSSVIIAGAGPAGLAAAIALRQAGVADVTVVERASLDTVLGSELSLHTAALRALETIGVARACVEAGAALEYSRFLAKDGTPLGEQRGGEVLTIDKSLPSRIGISRPALHGVLEREALKRGCTIKHNCELTGLSQTDERVSVELSTGEQLSAELLLAADGVNSVVRSIVFPDAPQPEYCGQVAWRARVPLLGEPCMQIFIDHKGKVGIIAVNDSESYLFHLEPEPSYDWIEREKLPEILRSKLEGYGGAVADVRDSIQDPQHVHYSPLCPILVPPPWHKGRVMLIGDAAHATTPHLAYGAALAMEDGVVLGEEMGRGLSLEDTLVAFTTRRWPRCKMVVENGVQIALWEVNPDLPGADPLGLGIRMQMALGDAI